MAQVDNRAAPSRQRIDAAIDYQLRAWCAMSERATWWQELDGPERETFQLEWDGITEPRLRELQCWEPFLTHRQQARYQELRDLIARLRPTLDRLLAT